jgi:hypothetical protein
VDCLDCHLSSIERLVANTSAGRGDDQTADLMFQGEEEKGFITMLKIFWFIMMASLSATCL